MIDWILIHHEIILYLSVGGIALIGAGAITYAGWVLVTDHLRRAEEHDKIMAEYRRGSKLIGDYLDQPLDQIPDKDTEEVIRRVL